MNVYWMRLKETFENKHCKIESAFVIVDEGAVCSRLIELFSLQSQLLDKIGDGSFKANAVAFLQP